MGTLHKLLHGLSKLFFYFCMALLYQYLVQTACTTLTAGLCGTLEQLYRDRVLSSILAALLAIISVALVVRRKEELAISLLLNLSMSAKELSKVLPETKPRTPLLDVEILYAISKWFSVFSEKGLTLRKVVMTPYFRASLLANILFMPTAALLLIVSSEYEPSIRPIPHLAIALFSIAVATSCVNVWLILPKCILESTKSESKEEKKNFLGRFLGFLIPILLGRYRYCIGEELSGFKKVLLILVLSLVMTIMVNPGDLLLPSKKRDADLGSQVLKSFAFVFVPSRRDVMGFPSVCEERDDTTRGEGRNPSGGQTITGDQDIRDIKVLVNNICIRAYKEVDLVVRSVKYSKLLPDLPPEETYAICTSVELNRHKEDIWREVIQRIEVVFNEVKANVRSLLKDFIVEELPFNNLKPLLGDRVNGVIERLYRYSIIESLRETQSSIKTVDKLWKLLSDVELIRDLGDLAEKFTLMMPIVFIRTIPISEIVLKGSPDRNKAPQVVPEKIYFNAYYCIPVLIAFNPLMKLQDVEELYKKVRLIKQEAS